MSVETDRIADIVREMRDRATRPDFVSPSVLKDYASRIEAVAKGFCDGAGEKSGNAAKLRIAIERTIRDLRDTICDPENGDDIMYIVGAIRHNIERLQDALAMPPRNCDVGTAEEQIDRFSDYCPRFIGGTCTGCSLTHYQECGIAWAQLPDKEGGEE